MAPKLDFFPIEEKTFGLGNRHPSVSIIIPARNEEGHIRKCLESLLEQNYLNIEIIAINDSSSDRTREIILEYSNLARSRTKIIQLDGPGKTGLAIKAI